MVLAVNLVNQVLSDLMISQVYQVLTAPLFNQVLLVFSVLTVF